MTLSDHLDMVGVTLMATWTQTRKVNGDVLQLRMKNTVRPWKAGKFLPLTQRSWSLNCYALSKVWFKSRCVDIRVCDTNAITSSCKSWLFQDMFEKPAEMILYRPLHYGGLGLHSPKYKALAGFISTFLQTAANPSFRQNLLHNQLYRKHVLDEDSVPGLPSQLPPYLTKDFFNLIKEMKMKHSVDIITLAERDWTKILTEEFITMEVNQESNTSEFRPCKAELASPSTDWTLSWFLCRQQGIPPDMASFLWKMLHNLLGTQERMHRLGSSPSALCKQCNQVSGTLKHELIESPQNDHVGGKLLSCLQLHMPGLTADNLLRLEFSNLDVDMELPCTIITAVTLGYIWKERLTSSRIRSYQVRSEIEQSINLLRTTRLANTATSINTLVSQMFQ